MATVTGNDRDRDGAGDPRLFRHEKFALEGAAALIVTDDNRYLMQLRSDRADLHMPGNWSLFGGVIEPGETARHALLRELREELEFTPRHAMWFTEISYAIPLTGFGLIHKYFFEVPVTVSEIAGMVLHEGDEMRLFSLDELARRPNVVPWDFYGVMVHARRETIRRPDPGQIMR